MREKMNVPTASVQPFMRLVYALRRAVPRHVNTLWMTAQLGIANEKTAKNYLAEFRTLGVIDDDGAVTEIGHRLRLEESFGEACQMILQSKYPPALLEAFAGSEPTEAAVTNALMRDGKAEGTAKRMAQFFLFLRRGLPTEAPKATRKSPENDRRGAASQPPLVPDEDAQVYEDAGRSTVAVKTEAHSLAEPRVVTTPRTTLRYWLKDGRTAELIFPSDISDFERKRLFRHIQIDLNDADREEEA